MNHFPQKMLDQFFPILFLHFFLKIKICFWVMLSIDISVGLVFMEYFAKYVLYTLSNQPLDLENVLNVHVKQMIHIRMSKQLYKIVDVYNLLFLSSIFWRYLLLQGYSLLYFCIKFNPLKNCSKQLMKRLCSLLKT